MTALAAPQQSFAPGELISFKEAGKRFGIRMSYYSIDRLARSGRLRFARIGNRRFTTEAWLNEMIEVKEPTNGSESA